MRVVDLGVVEYARALALQRDAVTEVLAGAPERLFLLEHDPVITVGRRTGTDNLLVSGEELRRRGVALIKSSRGGEITCHFPGQLVAYPIFRIDRRRGGVRRFFWELEEVVLNVLNRCGIAARRIQGMTGVFAGERKIASMGIGVHRWVSYHGLALNVGTDLSLFSLMHPCGLQGVRATSVHLELGGAGPSMHEVKEMTRDAFDQVFASA